MNSFLCNNRYSNTSCLSKSLEIVDPDQTACSVSSPFAFLTSILWILVLITNFLFENRTRKVFGNLEHFSYHIIMQLYLIIALVIFWVNTLSRNCSGQLKHRYSFEIALLSTHNICFDRELRIKVWLHCFIWKPSIFDILGLVWCLCPQY